MGYGENRGENGVGRKVQHDRLQNENLVRDAGVMLDQDLAACTK